MDYDAFLSHHTADKPLIRELRRRLMAQDLRVWLDEEDLRPGQRWQDGLAAGILASGSVIVCIGGSGIGPWEDEEMQAALDLAARDHRPVIPVLLPGAPERPAISLFLKNRTWVDLRGGIDSAGIGRLVWGITGDHPGADARAAPDRRCQLARHSFSQSSSLDVLSVKEVLRPIIMAEVGRQLRYMGIPTNDSQNVAMTRLIANPSFTGRLRNIDPLNRAANIPPASQLIRLDPTAATVLREEKVSVAFSAILLGVAAIFFYLRDILGYRLEMTFGFAHGIELLHFVKSRPIFDAFVVADAPSLQIFNRDIRGHSFGMFMPQVDHRVMASRATKRKHKVDTGIYAGAVKDGVTTVIFEREHLERTCSIDSKKVKLEHWQPEAYSDILLGGDPDWKLIVWSPHYKIYSALGIGEIISQRASRLTENILFFEESFLGLRGHAAKSLMLAIVDAWVSLLEPQECSLVVEKMLQDRSYLKALKYFSGIFSLADLPANTRRAKDAKP